MSGTSGLARFLHELATDPELLKEYLQNPAKVLKGRSDLTGQQKFLLLANDLEAIQKELQAEVGDDAVLYTTVWHGPQPPTVWGP
jgi:hypothetical protein